MCDPLAGDKKLYSVPIRRRKKKQRESHEFGAVKKQGLGYSGVVVKWVLHVLKQSGSSKCSVSKKFWRSC